MRKIWFCFLCLALLICAVACAREDRSCEDLLAELCRDKELAAGELYLYGRSEGEAGYLSPATAAALYGERAQDILSLCEDYAIYLASHGAPCEAAVFKCYSASDCDRVASALLERIDEIKIALKGTSLSIAYDGASVSIKGRYVLLLPDQNINK